MNKIPPAWISMCSFLSAAAILLAGCAGTSDSTSSPEKDYSTENTGNTSTGQTDAEPLPPDCGDTASEDAGSETAQDWQYSWQEITITLPAEWQDLCVIQETTNGFSIFQKASYEADKDGYICSFIRTSEYLNYGTGETLLAYTDAGLLYYLMQPTDFACASDNKDIIDEYSRMCTRVDDLAAGLRISASDRIHYDAEEFVLPVSSLLPLNREFLVNLSDNELWIARNEIFARHGRIFTNEYLQLRFDSCTWYQGTIAPEQFDDSVLTRTEQDNIQLLIAAEQEYDRQHPYPRQCAASETVMADLSGNGIANSITYQVSREYPEKCELTIDGNSQNLYEQDEFTLDYAHTGVFYITDIMENDNYLEIAILDLGPSIDLVTHFFRYDGALSYIGTVGGWPFAELNSGINGFNGSGWITGKTRTDLIETAYPEGYWRYDFTQGQIVCQETTWHSYFFRESHTLYEDLPVHSKPDPSSETIILPANTEICFLSTDLEEWILVKDKNGDKGYMQVAGGEIVDLGKPADKVISNLDFYD